MRFIALVFLMVLSVAFAQFGDFYSGGVFGPSGVNGFPLNGAQRDPRQNTGPVVFPASPPGAPEESSGVIVGASGYGFVPPGAQGFFRYYHHQFLYQ